MIRYLILGKVLEIHRLVDPVDGKLESAIAQRLAHAQRNSEFVKTRRHGQY